MRFVCLMKGDRPTTPKTKPNNHSTKTALPKLSNKIRNEVNQKLETAGGV
jgi:hypothetical protein